MTQAVTRQLTVSPLAATNDDFTTNGVGVTSGSPRTSGSPMGLEKALAPVVNGTKAVSHRSRSSVHCRSSPPVRLMRKPRTVTSTVSPFIRFEVPVMQEPKVPAPEVVRSVERHTSMIGAVKPGWGGGGRTGW